MSRLPAFGRRILRLLPTGPLRLAMIDLLSNPSAWIGLLTLVLLELVLGIDNLVFIAILADKLPPHQRDKARVVGMSLALVMRLGLLTMVSWLVTWTTPLFTVMGFSLSGRDLILLVGGMFLLFKATSELHERLEGGHATGKTSAAYASFSIVVAQIVVLDAVFSLDAVITAVGMVKDLPVIMAAVVISIGIMMLAAKPLTKFVNAHPTVVVLCLSFLLMIGLSLVSEALGFHLPKGYLYAAIGFSIAIEFFNQWARRSFVKAQSARPLRERTAESVLHLLGGRHLQGSHEATPAVAAAPAFAPEERNMVSGVLTLAERTVRSIMTPRTDISWVDLNDSVDSIRDQLLETPHGMFPVCRGSLDHVVGVGRAKDLLGALARNGRIDPAQDLRAPIYVPENVGVIELISVLRKAHGKIALVNDEHGNLKGVVSPIDILEAIAGEFPDEDESLEVQSAGNVWHVAGTADLHLLEQTLGVSGLVSADDTYISVAGFLVDRMGRLPAAGEVFVHEGFDFRIDDADDQRIKRVTVERAATEIEESMPA